MKISEVTAITGLSPDTLRYYEKIGLLQISRDGSGHRNYSDEDLAWIRFIIKLKVTGMPIKEIVIYSDLRAQGQSTFAHRLQLLQAHKMRIEDDIEKLKANLSELKKKISYYQENL